MKQLELVLLPELGRDLITQVEAFGLIGQYTSPSLDDLKWLAQTRLAPIRLFVGAVEQMGNTQLLGPETPLLYHTAGWPRDAPPAGRIGQTNAVRSTDHLGSLPPFWVLQIQEKSCLPAALKLVRAALWTVRAQGFAQAVEDLAALGSRGFICEPQALIEAFDLLLTARRRVKDDLELPDYLLPGANGCAPADWPKLDFGPALAGGKLLRPELDDDIELLIEITDGLIATARAAQSYGEWCLACWRLGMMARTAHITMRRLGVAEDIAYAGFAARYDEISADMGSFAIVSRMTDGVAGERLGPRWGMASAMAKMAASNANDWLDRMLDERVLVPDALLDTYHANSELLSGVLPLEWRAPPATLRPIMARLLFQDGHYAFRRATATSEAETDVEADTAAIRAGIIESMRLADARDLARSLALITDLATAYPSCSPTRHERAIRLDESGKPDEAWTEVRDALLLDPNMPGVWQSAAVILEHLGHTDDARVTAGMAHVLREQQAAAPGGNRS